VATTGALPTSAKELHTTILGLNTATRAPATWKDLGSAMSQLESGTPLRYVGAAAEYAFDQYGAAQHTIMDAWTVKDTTFVELGAVSASCLTTK
jgi:neutral amino acid transport system substrate-binding protein